jgi:uncharacterized protein YuzE
MSDSNQDENTWSFGDSNEDNDDDLSYKPDDDLSYDEDSHDDDDVSNGEDGDEGSINGDNDNNNKTDRTEPNNELDHDTKKEGVKKKYSNINTKTLIFVLCLIVAMGSCAIAKSMSPQDDNVTKGEKVNVQQHFPDNQVHDSNIMDTGDDKGLAEDRIVQQNIMSEEIQVEIDSNGNVNLGEDTATTIDEAVHEEIQVEIDSNGNVNLGEDMATAIDEAVQGDVLDEDVDLVDDENLVEDENSVKGENSVEDGNVQHDDKTIQEVEISFNYKDAAMPAVLNEGLWRRLEFSLCIDRVHS